MDSILVVNAGSSSVKFQVFQLKGAKSLSLLLKGQVDGVGAAARLRVHASDGAIMADQTFSARQMPDVNAALNQAASWLRQKQNLQPIAAGHRVAHGGPDHDRPSIVDRTLLDSLERYIPLAPLHQPYNLTPIKALLENRPRMLQVACFDTAFHRGHGSLADHYAIPEQFYVEGVRRYGFHGLSYEYVAERMRQVAPDAARKRMIVAHLGNGSSMCALFDGRSVESTMGFTALDGLPMGTRPGQLDPGVVLYLISQKGVTPAAVQELLYRESGLKALSGISNDMRELQASKTPQAAFAIDYFVYRVVLHAGLLASALGGLDAFVFTAGIGENACVIRARITEKLGWLGASLDSAANAEHALLISAPESRVAVYVVPTNEELMIVERNVG